MGKGRGVARLLIALLLARVLAGCPAARGPGPAAPPAREARSPESPAASSPAGTETGTTARADGPAASDRADEREAMVRSQIEMRGLRDPRVLHAMREVRRHLFVPAELRDSAYDDCPLPIGHGQTISQPYVVAFMCESLSVGPEDRVLEIGTGSGYHAAVLARLAREVYTIEIVEPLGREAARRFEDLGLSNVRARIGDGYRGWPEAAPFDRVLVTAAPDHIPEPLVAQLAPGGILILPVGEAGGEQNLVRVRKRSDGALEREEILPVRFVPMTGEAEIRGGGGAS